MNFRRSYILRVKPVLFASALLMLLATACNNSVTRTAPFFVTPNQFSLKIGESKQLMASRDESIITGWSSSNPSVAIVKNGLVVGVSLGDAQIFASIATGDSVPAIVSVINP